MSIVFLVMMCSSTVLTPVALVSCATPVADTQAGKEAAEAISIMKEIAARQKAGEVIAAGEIAEANKRAEEAEAALAAEKAKSVAANLRVDSTAGTIKDVAEAAAPYVPVPWAPVILAQVPSIVSIVGMAVKQFTGHSANVGRIEFLEREVTDLKTAMNAAAVAAGPVMPPGSSSRTVVTSWPPAAGASAQT
jgi:hypothetical protein